MQRPGELIPVPAGLQGKVYFDEAERIIWIENNEITRQSTFITYMIEIKERYGEVKVLVDKERDKLKQEKKHTFTSGEEVLTDLQSILTAAVRERVSDIHIEITQNSTNVFMRKNGMLKELSSYSRETGDRIAQAIFSNSQEASHVSFSEKEYQYSVIRQASFMPSDLEGIRVQRGPMFGGHFVVLRLLYKTVSKEFEVVKGESFEDTVKKNFSKYGYSDYTVRKLIPALRSGDGLVLISGPTGSGKSTALKIMLELVHMLYPYKSIFTIEDPPEYKIAGAKQLPVPEGGSFLDVLKVAMRSDPDIIMIGELRDEKTARTALDAVITGHQVYGTIHAKDTVAILERIKRLGVEIEELVEGDKIKFICSQRLVPKVCEYCKQEVSVNGIEGYHGTGCNKCKNTGISGRVVVEESIGIQDLKDVNNDLNRVRDYLKDKREDLISKSIRLVKNGVISPIHAMAFVGYFSKEEYYS